MAEFVHLHTHSDYSLLGGACRVHDLVQKVRHLGMRACALTDHGNLFGAIEFYQAALSAGVKPIIGMEAYVAPGSLHEKKDAPGMRDSSHHLTLLCRNEKGYRNLLKLTSISHREGFYHKPRIDREVLAEHHEGLIALSGCPHSEFARALKSDQMDKALKCAADYRDIMGSGNYYLEIHNHGLSDGKVLLEGALSVSKELGIKVVATNNCHYLNKDDARAHDALLAIASGKRLEEEERTRYPTPEFYVKSPEEMAALFPDLPEALRTSLEISEKCNVELFFDQVHLPRFELPSKEDTADSYLRTLCEEGARVKYADPIPKHVMTRLDHELGVIGNMGFAGYFLIVWDLRRFALEADIRVGPGRGSAAGSLVSYLLGITSIDPLRYDLIFERFLNPSRKEMPDIDLDFAGDDRQAVMDYIREKYGQENVAQIITFGKMKARAVLRDVGRVLGIPLGEVDALAKKVPQVLDITLRDAIRMEPEIQKEVDSDPRKKELWEISLKLEGMNRHASKHASGIVISDRPLDEVVPVYMMDEDEVTQFDMNILTRLGMLKIDVLGLEMLSVLSRAIRLIDPGMDLDKIPIDDRKTYDMLAKGRVKGVFQLETSRGMRELIQQMKPDRIEELIASIAMFRPGPLGSGMVDTYVKCKHGQEEVKYLHPMLEPILKETNGVILYQEQVMRIANQMAGLPMSDCDALRKAMGKKKPEILAQYKEMFLEGAKKLNVSAEIARSVFDLMAYFGGYGFNKSHSAAYGILCYQTAYLKANHPLEYMSALMSCTMGNFDKMAGYIEECRQMEIEVLPPDINRSDHDFTVEDGRIRVGLGTVKNVGEKAVRHIIKIRSGQGEYSDFHQLLENVDLRAVDKKSLECLAKAGAFDSLGILRSQLLEVLEGSLRISTLRREDREAGQMSIFGQEAHEDYPALPDIEEWPQETLLGYEKDALGFYVSSNPLVRYEDLLKSYSTTTVDRMGDLEDGAEVTVGGILSGLRTMVAKTGKNKGSKFVGFKISDLTGVVEAVSFPTEYARNQDHFFEDHIVFATGRVSFRNENVSLRVSNLVPAMKAREVLTGTATVEIPGAGDDRLLAEVHRVLGEHPGSVPVLLEVALAGSRKVLVRAPDRCMISPSEAFIADIEEVLGSGHLRFSGKSVR